MKKILSFLKLFALSMLMILGFSNTLFGQYDGNGTFSKITSLSELTDGYYVIGYETTNQAMSNTNAGTYFTNVNMNAVGGVITNPAQSIVWKIETNGENKTIYNEASDRYVSYTGSSNAAYATNPSPLTNAEMWTFDYVSNLFRIQNVNVTTRFLQYNATSGQTRFACYTGTQQHITLYKLSPQEGTDLFEDFETLLSGNGSYGGANVTFGSGVWFVAGMTTMDANDRRNGARSIRLRGNSGDNCYVAMTFDKPNGLGTLSFKYGSYSTHSGGKIVSYYSTDGNTWIEIGEVTSPAWSGALEEVEYEVNVSGNVRVKIAREGSLANSTTVNVDDISITDYGVSNPLVASPEFSPNGGGYTSTQTVAITCATEGAAIYHTTNGSDPTTSSTLYTTPIALNTAGTHLIKAIGVKEGYDNSPIISSTFIIKLYEPEECDLFVDFEEAVWEGTGYAPRTVTDQWGTWQVAGVVVGTDPGDHLFDTKSIRLRGNTSDINNNLNRVEMLFDRPNGIESISFNYASYSSHSNGSITVQYSTNQGATWITADSIHSIPSWVVGGSKMLETTVAIGIPQSVRLRITKVSQSGSTSVNIDNICIKDYPSNAVATPTFTPMGGNYITTQSVTINCSTEGATIYYTTNGTDPTTGSSVYTTPINVSTTTTLKAMATKAGMDDSGIGTAVYTFPIEVANIAAFKAANSATSSVRYKITGDVTFVYRSGRYMYVKDATGGLAIYDNATPIVTTAYNNGDNISGGIIGTCAMSGGLCQFVPVANFAAGTPGTPVQPVTLTMADLKADFSAYESQLVKLEKIEFAAGTFATGAAGNISIYQSSSQMICRNHYGNITGYTTDPSKRFDVTGFAIPYNADHQIAPRDLDDIVETQSFTISVSASPSIGGSVAGGGAYYIDDEATITATPAVSHNFINWTEGGSQVTTNTQYSFTVTQNRTFVANFQIKTYTITSSTGSNGTISPLGTHTYNHGTSQEYTITPNPGYAIDQVLVNGVNNSGAVASGTYTFTNITANQTISVSFKLKQYTLTLDPSTGTVNPLSIPVTYNTAIGSIPTPTQPNCIFKGWFIGTTQIFPYTIWTWTSDETAIAVFDYPIVATNSNPALGTISPTGTAYYSLDETANYICTPIDGAHITTVVVNNVTVFTGDNEETKPYTHTFENINSYNTIHVGFAMNCYALNPENVVGTGANITMTPANCVQHGGNATIYITSNCYQITQILIDGENQGVSSIYSYSIPLNNVTESLPKIEVVTKQDQYEILATPLSDPLGAIVPSGLATVNCGENKTYQFITDLGVRVKTLLIDNVSVPVPASESYTFYHVNDNHTIHVEFEEFPQYTIHFGPSAAQQQGGSVFPTENPSAVNYVHVDSGTVSYQFSIVPATGYVIDKVLIDNIVYPATDTYTFNNVLSNHSIFATFKPIMFTITASAGANGTINPAGAVPVAYGTDPTFQIIPNVGSFIAEVLVDGVPNANAVSTGSYTFPYVTTNHTISATFTKHRYTITTIAGPNGEITPVNPEVEHGANQTIYFIPALGYKVHKVFIDGNENSGAALAGSFTFLNVTAPHTISVTFTIIQLTITATHTVGGYIIPAGTITVDYGDHSPVFVFDYHEGYHIKKALIDDLNDPQAVSDKLYRFMNVKTNHTIHIEFAPNYFIIEATATEGGTINPSGEVAVPTGNSQLFHFAPKAGYDLVRVLINGINNPDAVAAGEYLFTDVLGNHTIAAQFEQKLYNVIYQPVPGALVSPVDGSTSPVEYGGTYKFIVDLEDGYTQSSITVRANGIIVNPAGGIYVINNIIIDQIITIEGAVLNKYEIISQAFNGGTITPAGIFVVTHGDDKTFEITPNAGYIISDIVVNGLSVGAVPFYTFNDIRTGATIKAYFKYNDLGIDDIEATINVFSYNNIITIVNEQLVPIKQVEIMDMYGRIIWLGQAPGTKTEIALDVAKGLYGVRILTGDNQYITGKVIIK